MNSAVSAYSSHSYYNSSDNLPTAVGHSAAAPPTGWSYAPPSNGKQGHNANLFSSYSRLLSVFDQYHSSPVSVSAAGAVVDYYSTSYPPVLNRYPSTGSTGTPSPHGFNNTNHWASPAVAAAAADQIYSQLTANYNQYQPNVTGIGKKRGVGNSKKERRRTISINGAFSDLRDCIPNVPKDTKLSKIKTLRLACGYIQHLMDALASDTPIPLHEFKADLSRKTPCRAEKRKCIEAEIAAAADRKCRGRSGWPQTIWAQDLKTENSGGRPLDTPHPYLSVKHSSMSLNPHQGSQESCASSFGSASSNIENVEGMNPSPSYHSSLCEESPVPSIAGSLG